MKKLSLLFISLLEICACNSAKSSKNTNTTDNGKYKVVNVYSYVSYRFDDQLRCVVHYDHYKGDEESGYVIDYSKDWCVYLKGYYYNKRGYEYNTFYECQYSSGTYDYYLYVIE